MNQNEVWSPFRAYSERAGSHHKIAWQDCAAICCLILLGLLLWLRASSLPAYKWNWQLLGEFIIRRNSHGQWEAGLLLRGFFTTLRIGSWTILFSLLPGFFIGILSSRKKIYIRLPCQIYVNLIRNIPPLVLLFCIYFFAGNLLPVASIEDAVRHLPPFFREGVALIFAPTGQMDRMIAAVLALGLYQSAYVAEIVRAGLESVNRGQWDAAKALGFSRWQSMRMVIFPQALSLMLPPLTGQFITTFKESALASLISLPDLTFQSLEIMAISRMTFEIWISTAILYLLIGLLCASVGRLLEKYYYFHLS